jgi:hypothetical protein
VRGAGAGSASPVIDNLQPVFVERVARPAPFIFCQLDVSDPNAALYLNCATGVVLNHKPCGTIEWSGRGYTGDTVTRFILMQLRLASGYGLLNRRWLPEYFFVAQTSSLCDSFPIKNHRQKA